jgi:hypothetical protein
LTPALWVRVPPPLPVALLTVVIRTIDLETTMTESEFLQKVFDTEVELFKKFEDKYSSRTLSYKPRFKKEGKDKVAVACQAGDFISVNWVVGGKCGGSCWSEGDSEMSEVTPHPEPDFESLDKILESVCPGVTYLQYKKLNSVIQTSKYSDYEYYGNYTDHATKFVQLGVLFAKLKEMDLV